MKNLGKKRIHRKHKAHVELSIERFSQKLMSEQTNSDKELTDNTQEPDNALKDSSHIDIEERGHTIEKAKNPRSNQARKTHLSLKAPRAIVKTQHKSVTVVETTNHGDTSEQHPDTEPTSPNTQLWQNGLRLHGHRSHREHRKPRHSQWGNVQPDEIDPISRTQYGRRRFHQSLEDTDSQEDSGYPGDGETSQSESFH